MTTTSPLPGGSQSTSAFAFPREYNFPPFFTRQTVATTYHAQCSKWQSLILSYCRAQRLFKLSLIDALDMDLFWNRRLNKRLTLVDAREVVEFMRKEGRAEWIGADRNLVWIWWRNPEEWAAAIADWVDETGQKNTVLTLYELTESEATLSQGKSKLLKALSILVKRGKAQVFGQEDQQGVKFF
ncbi:ESCRT-II complex subunit [Phlyctema vagabunda]|uniref:ESCRT-II complex subunit n=1 Tax=Phlyctema vagabunda TaxID=108571 RepID=A0ABR4PBS9_9HELO